MGETNGSQKEKRRRSSQEAGFGGVVDFLRGIPDRLKRPETLLMMLAMLASLGAHMPPWVGLGALVDYFDKVEREKQKAALSEPAEISFEINDTPSESQKPEKEPEPEREKPKLAEQKPKPEPEKPKPAQPEPPPPEPKKEVALQIKPELAPPPPEPPPSQRRKQSITQKSDDPDVEPPPDAKYLAEESRRVEEETVASITDLHRDDPEPNNAAPQAAGPEEAGDSLREEKGAAKGAEQGDEKKVAAVSKTDNKPSREPPETTPSQQPSQQPADSNKPARPSKSAVTKQEEVLAEPTVVHDPMGTFVLAPSRSGQAGREGQAASAGNAKKIKVSWSAFEATFGAEQLAQDRLPKEAKRRGAGREKRWDEFRAAIENYVVGAKPGNTTALNAAADPFAAYLAAFHRNLHAEFAHEFLASLPALGELADFKLVTKVEIVVNPDGSLDRVGVVKSSGNMMYDFGAFNAVQRGAPYPPPPEKIRSPDGRVYIVWALHRDESQCGTWNAEPHILKNPPRSPSDPKPDNVSPYRPSAPRNDPTDAKQGRAPVYESTQKQNAG